MKQKLLCFFMLGILLIGSVYAQERRISGRVVAADDGAPLSGVSVVVPGTNVATQTDALGTFTIHVPTTVSSLQIRSLGFVSQMLSLTDASNYSVSLALDETQLSEVVVTAFGIQREKRQLTYSQQEVKGEGLVKVGQPNLTNALQGKVAGVQVNQSSGMPGASSFIRIRGSNSFNLNNEPLFVIDGMPIENRASGTGGVSGADYSSRALDINIEDVESVSVLKGATAAALYGLRASNGVVLITTKKGSRGATKAKITVSQTNNFDVVSVLPDLQNTYAQGGGGMFQVGASTSWGPRIEDLGKPEFNTRAVGNTGRYVNVIGQEVTPQKYDNVSPIFSTGHLSTTNLGISGGFGGQGTYALNAGYAGQTGIINPTGMEKWNFRLSGDYDLSDKWKAGANFNFVSTDIDKLAGGSNLSNALFTTYWAPVSYDLWGLPYAAEDNPYAQIHYRGAMDNPRWGLANNSFNEHITRSFGNIFLEYKPIADLTLRYQAGLDAYSETNKEIYSLGSGETGGRAGILLNTTLVNSSALPSGGRITEYYGVNRQFNSNFFALYNKSFGEFHLDATVGNEVIDVRNSYLNVEGSGIQIGGFDNLNNTASQLTTKSGTNSRQVGTYANVNISFRDMLYLNGSFRHDVVSNMPRGRRAFNYPSLGLGFVFTELIEKNTILSYGKVRASYAEVGKVGPVYVATTPFEKSEVGTGFTTDGIGFPFNGKAGFSRATSLISTDLRPQNTVSYEIGGEFRFFKDRLTVDVTYFNDRTVDQIFAVPMTITTGYSSETRNAGEMRGQGWEVMLGITPVSTANFRWDFSTNFTRVRNDVISLADGVDNIFLGGFVTPNVRAYAGSAYPILFGSKFLRDKDGNIVYDGRQFLASSGSSNPAYGMPVRDPLNAPIGNVNPNFEIGFINTFSYKAFSLTAQVDLRSGGMAWAGNTRLQKSYGMDAVTEDRETPWVGKGVKGYFTTDPETGAAVVDVYGENDIAILRGQDYWNVYMDAIEESNMFSTSYLRLRELNFSYRFPQSILSKAKISDASVFVSGRNLLLFTNYPNFDPETSVGGAANFQGLEYVNLPQTKSYGLGLRVTF